jgi:hypothetical protein
MLLDLLSKSSTSFVPLGAGREWALQSQSPYAMMNAHDQRSSLHAVALL